MFDVMGIEWSGDGGIGCDGVVAIVDGVAADEEDVVVVLVVVVVVDGRNGCCC